MALYEPMGPGIMDKIAYGAIVYSGRTGGYGYSFSHPDLNTAEQVARQHCGDSAAQCVRGRNSYLALAKSANGAYGLAGHESSQKAEREALANCVKFGGTSPTVVLLIHTWRGLAYDHVQTPPSGTNPANPPSQPRRRRGFFDPRRIFSRWMP